MPIWIPGSGGTAGGGPGGSSRGGGGSAAGALLRQRDNRRLGIFISAAKADESWHLRGERRVDEVPPTLASITIEGEDADTSVRVNIPEDYDGGSPAELNSESITYNIHDAEAVEETASIDVGSLNIASTKTGEAGNADTYLVEDGAAGVEEVTAHRDVGDLRVSSVKTGAAGNADSLTISAGTEEVPSESADADFGGLNIESRRVGALGNVDRYEVSAGTPAVSERKAGVDIGGIRVDSVRTGVAGNADLFSVTAGNPAVEAANSHADVALSTGSLRITSPDASDQGDPEYARTNITSYSSGQLINFRFHERGPSGNGFRVRFFSRTVGAIPNPGHVVNARYNRDGTQLRIEFDIRNVAIGEGGLGKNIAITEIISAVNAARYNGEQLVVASDGPSGTTILWVAANSGGFRDFSAGNAFGTLRSSYRTVEPLSGGSLGDGAGEPTNIGEVRVQPAQTLPAVNVTQRVLITPDGDTAIEVDLTLGGAWAGATGNGREFHIGWHTGDGLVVGARTSTLNIRLSGTHTVSQILAALNVANIPGSGGSPSGISLSASLVDSSVDTSTQVTWENADGIRRYSSSGGRDETAPALGVAWDSSLHRLTISALSASTATQVRTAIVALDEFSTTTVVFVGSATGTDTLTLPTGSDTEIDYVFSGGASASPRTPLAVSDSANDGDTISTFTVAGVLSTDTAQAVVDAYTAYSGSRFSVAVRTGMGSTTFSGLPLAGNLSGGRDSAVRSPLAVTDSANQADTVSTLTISGVLTGDTVQQAITAYTASGGSRFTLSIGSGASGTDALPSPTTGTLTGGVNGVARSPIAITETTSPTSSTLSIAGVIASDTVNAIIAAAPSPLSYFTITVRPSEDGSSVIPSNLIPFNQNLMGGVTGVERDPLSVVEREVNEVDQLYISGVISTDTVQDVIDKYGGGSTFVLSVTSSGAATDTFSISSFPLSGNLEGGVDEMENIVSGITFGEDSIVVTMQRRDPLSSFSVIGTYPVNGVETTFPPANIVRSGAQTGAIDVSVMPSTPTGGVDRIPEGDLEAELSTSGKYIVIRYKPTDTLQEIVTALNAQGVVSAVGVYKTDLTANPEDPPFTERSLFREGGTTAASSGALVGGLIRENGQTERGLFVSHGDLNLEWYLSLQRRQLEVPAEHATLEWRNAAGDATLNLEIPFDWGKKNADGSVLEEFLPADQNSASVRTARYINSAPAISADASVGNLTATSRRVGELGNLDELRLIVGSPIIPAVDAPPVQVPGTRGGNPVSNVMTVSPPSSAADGNGAQVVLRSPDPTAPWSPASATVGRMTVTSSTPGSDRNIDRALQVTYTTPTRANHIPSDSVILRGDSGGGTIANAVSITPPVTGTAGNGAQVQVVQSNTPVSAAAASAVITGLRGSATVNSVVVNFPEADGDAHNGIIIGLTNPWTTNSVAASGQVRIHTSASDGIIDLSYNTAGTAGNGFTITVQYDGAITNHSVVATYTSATAMTVGIRGSVTRDVIVAAINAARHSGSQLITATPRGIQNYSTGIWSSSVGPFTGSLSGGAESAQVAPGTSRWNAGGRVMSVAIESDNTTTAQQVIGWINAINNPAFDGTAALHSSGQGTDIILPINATVTGGVTEVVGNSGEVDWDSTTRVLTVRTDGTVTAAAAVTSIGGTSYTGAATLLSGADNYILSVASHTFAGGLDPVARGANLTVSETTMGAAPNQVQRLQVLNVAPGEDTVQNVIDAYTAATKNFVISGSGVVIDADPGSSYGQTLSGGTNETSGFVRYDSTGRVLTVLTGSAVAVSGVISAINALSDYGGVATAVGVTADTFLNTSHTASFTGGSDEVPRTTLAVAQTSHGSGNDMFYRLTVSGVVPAVDTVAQVIALYASTTSPQFTLTGTGAVVASGQPDSMPYDGKLTGGIDEILRHDPPASFFMREDGDILVTLIRHATEGTTIQELYDAILRSRYFAAGDDPDGSRDRSIPVARLSIQGSASEFISHAAAHIPTTPSGGVNYIPPDPIEASLVEGDPSGSHLRIEYHESEDTLQEIYDSLDTQGVVGVQRVWGTNMNASPESSNNVTRSFYR